MTSLLIVGLGNPGSRYQGTRHNIGYELADLLSGAHPIRQAVGDMEGDLFEVSLREFRVGVLKPTTFMNRSGVSVALAMEKLNLGPGQLVVIHDELDLPLGTVRLKHGGGEAGHRGLRSISEELGSREYLRLRLGIGRPVKEVDSTVSEFVLARFALAESTLVERCLHDGVAALKLLLEHGPQGAMNQINRRG